MRLRMVLVPAVAMASLVGLGLPAQAAGPASDAQVIGVTQRIAATGTLGAADRALLKTRPELAAYITDPALSTTITSDDRTVRVPAPEGQVLPTGPAGTIQAAVNYCRSITVTRIGRSTLGFQTYRFNHILTWCYNGSTVYANPERRYTITNLDFTREWQGLIGDYRSPLNRVNLRSEYQGKLSTCIPKLSCFFEYPFVGVTMGNNGSFLYNTSG